VQLVMSSGMGVGWGRRRVRWRWAGVRRWRGFRIRSGHRAAFVPLNSISRPGRNGGRVQVYRCARHGCV